MKYGNVLLAIAALLEGVGFVCWIMGQHGHLTAPLVGTISVIIALILITIVYKKG